jgi:SIR2-like domain
MMEHGDTGLHLRAIRKALADGNAAVMVGSGFSRNADGGDQLATWPQLAELLWRELNPTDKPSGPFSAGQITQLAEQYALVFSPPALENFLKREVPDDKVSPGDLHDQLLRLPWSDIFTTNYDTLLERAAEKDIGRAHYTISCREDIPQSKVLNRRRIVKLHGSFPSLRPFIFTEEDYRRYPEKFAPFVNMVRQSLLENVFCLVGFSGDDPNFLNWIGWIRDMLDKHALPIYLFVTKEPTIGLRRLLESRRITTVVLPSSNQGDHEDYRSRYAELFRILATPLKPNDAEWTASLQLPKEFRTVIVETNDERIARLLSVVPNLRQLRKRYPGWLIAPSTVRTNLHRRLQELPISLEAKILYDKTSGRSGLVRIVLIDQYAWYQEVLLQCLNDSLAEIALELLRDTRSFQNGTMFDGEKEDLKRIGVTSLKEVQKSWRDLGLALLRWARQELHEARFEEIKKLLFDTFVSDQDIDDELTHETILFALYSGERDEARRLLLDWSLRTSDAYMGIRKGALLAEVEEGVVGLSVSIDALQSLRRRQKLHPDNARYLSEEAWANYIVQRQHDAMGFAAPESIDTRGYEAIGQRLADLAGKGFDVQAEIREIAADLNSEAQPLSTPHALKQRFDLGKYIPSYGMDSGFSLNKKVSAAFAWLSLSDRVGLAPRMNRVSFDITSYTQAAWWLQNFDSPQRVLSVAIRTLNKKVLDPKDDTKPPHMSGWLTRFQIAKSEPPRLHRRLPILRRWSHDEAKIFQRSPRARRAHGARASARPSVGMGYDPVGGRQARLHAADAAQLGAQGTG